MNVDYNNFAKNFAQSRKNMKWEELEYFFSFIKEDENILDIGCGSGRLIDGYTDYFGKGPQAYKGVDLSEGLLQEARDTHPEYTFEEKNMLDIHESDRQNIFLIASFHHLKTFGERESMMKVLFQALQDGGKIFMTQWALESPVNKEKYKSSYMDGSINKFGSKDFSIKFGEFSRYYHSFSLSELEYLAKNAGFHILENRLFSTEKNIITILHK